MTPRGRGSPAARSVHVAVILLAVAAALVGVIVHALVVTGPIGGSWEHVLFLLVAWIYAAAGALAWWRRPSNLMGAIMVGGSFALLVAQLGNTGVPVLVAVGTIGATVILPVMVHLLHAFPSGTLHGAASRVTVVAAYGVSLVLQAPLYLFTPAPSPHHLLAVANRPDLADAGGWLQSIAGTAVMVATTVLLIGRIRRTDAARWRVLVPLYAYGIVAVLFIPVSARILGPLLNLSVSQLAVAQLIVIGGVPLAFAFAVLRGGFARTGQIDELAAWLGSAADERSRLGDALADTLGDPSLRLAFWAPDVGRYVDADGRPVALPTADAERATATIEIDGRRVGAIDYDATLLAEADDVRAAGRVVALAVDRERLTAALLASENALRRSRERLVEAADEERRRIGRNLHDGVQARLVLLALQAQQVADDSNTPASVSHAAIELRAGIDDAATELRQLVHAVMPAALVERGLSAATEDLVDHLPIPTHLRLDVPDRMLPKAVESTAYFVVAEALTNCVKHARAHKLSVELAVNADHLVIDVTDDGIGGADLGDGMGLRGIADRIDVLGGRMRIDSAPGSGTHLVAELPCRS